MIAHEQILIQKIRQLPPQRLAEIEDFIDFLCLREENQNLVKASMQISEASFNSVWANDEDADYDNI
jgi:hypothetical protein